jgi:hypothetical protein
VVEAETLARDDLRGSSVSAGALLLCAKRGSGGGVTQAACVSSDARVRGPAVETLASKRTEQRAGERRALIHGCSEAVKAVGSLPPRVADR